MVGRLPFRPRKHIIVSPFDSEHGAAVFLRSRYLDTEAQRLENLALGLETKIREFQAQVKEYRDKSQRMQQQSKAMRQEIINASKPRRRPTYV